MAQISANSSKKFVEINITPLQSCYCIFCVLLAAVFFAFVRYNVYRLFLLPFWPPLKYKEKDDAKKRAYKKWWRESNFTSFIHSLISGSWALTACLLYPVLEDIVHTGRFWAVYHLALVSMGYFVYDAIDMYLYDPGRRSYEFIVHHIFCIWQFCWCYIENQYMGYAVCALLMEVNSIFLHSRVILNMHGVVRHSVIYRIVSIFNIVTFLIFRFLVAGWMWRWALRHRHIVSTFLLYVIGFMGLVVVSVLNIFLFYRILLADGYWRGFTSMGGPFRLIGTLLGESVAKREISTLETSEISEIEIETKSQEKKVKND